MSTGTAEKPKEKAAKANGAVADAAAALGTGAVIDDGPQDVHDGDEVAQSASGAPVQLGFTVGGKRPTGSQVRLVGGKIDVPGNYSKGQVVAFRVTVKFGEIAFVDLEDKETGQVIGCDRRQKGRIIGVTELS